MRVCGREGKIDEGGDGRHRKDGCRGGVERLGSWDEKEVINNKVRKKESWWVWWIKDKSRRE